MLRGSFFVLGMSYLSEDIIREKGRDILGFYDSETAQSGVGQLTSWKKLSFKGIQGAPDGWYLPKIVSLPAIVVEFKSNSTPLRPKFNVVERPNDWTRSIKKLDTLISGEALKLDFWQSFNNYANNNTEFKKVFKLRKPQTWHWYDLSVGIGNVSVQFTVNTNTNVLTAGLNVYDFDTDQSTYDTYKENESELKQLLDCKTINWKASTKSARFYISRPVKLKDPDTWSEAFDWLCNQALVLRKFAKSHNK